MEKTDITINKRLLLSYNILNPVMEAFKHYSGILIGLAVLCIFLSIASPAFLTTANFLNVFRQISINANIAIGMTLAILICGIDLSVGSILALAGTVTAGLIVRNGMPVPAAVMLGIIVGGGCGLFNGLAIAYTGMPPFIVTLAMMQIARGLAYVYTAGQPIRVYDEAGQAFNAIGAGYLGPIPLPIIYTMLIFFVVLLLLNKTKFGRHIYAYGGNKDAAIFSGINTKKIEILVFTIVGLLSGISGIVLCSRMYSGQPTSGVGFELDAIAAVVLGGTSFSGGIGRLGGTLLGALLMGFLNNGLNLLNISSFWQLVAKGLVILIAVSIDMLKKRRALA
jgi:ribose transport system permease protein